MSLESAVTVVISRRVKPGLEAEFEKLSLQMTEAAAKFEGYLGSTMLKPSDELDPEYRIIFRFDEMEHLDVWNHSTERHQLLNDLEPLLLSQTREELFDGIASWFSFPGTTAKQAPHPNKLRMTLVSWMALYPTVTIIFILFGSLLEPVPLVIRTLIITGIVMFMMSYVLMPRFTRWFKQWIFSG